MNRLRIVIGVIAVLAAAATAATSASAATPEWYGCIKVPKIEKMHHGAYNDKHCSSPNAEGRGRYELRPGAGGDSRLRGKSHQAVLHVKTYAGDIYVVCKKTSDSGVPTAPSSETDVELDLTQCVLEGQKHEVCTSDNTKIPGELRFHAMEGELGYIQESPDVVGLRLEQAEEIEVPASERVVTSFNCGEELRATVRGQLVGIEQGNIDATGKKSELILAAGENLGTLETEGMQFAPLVNLLSFAGEEGAPQVLTATLCGTRVESLYGSECTPSEYAGLDLTVHSKSEGRMITT